MVVFEFWIHSSRLLDRLVLTSHYRFVCSAERCAKDKLREFWGYRKGRPGSVSNVKIALEWN